MRTRIPHVPLQLWQAVSRCGTCRPDGDESFLQAFNVTAVPSMLVYQMGTKHLDRSIRVDGDVAGMLLRSPKTVSVDAVAVCSLHCV